MPLSKRSASVPIGAPCYVGAVYSASVTCSPQLAEPSVSERWVMKWSGATPCPCHSPGPFVSQQVVFYFVCLVAIAAAFGATSVALRLLR